MEFLGKTIPAEWLETRARLSAVLQRPVVLAGGALRDLVWGFPPKDLDFFVPGPIHTANNVTHYMGWVWDWGVSGTLGSYMWPEVAHVQQFRGLPGDRGVYQIIYLDLPDFNTLAVAQRPDFAACQVATDGETVEATYAALRDLSEHRMTLVHAEDQHQFDRSALRAKRFADRYGAGVSFDLSAGFHLFPEMQ